MEGLIENFKRISEQSFARQLTLLIGLAASIAIGIGITMWAEGKAYSVLFADLDAGESAEVIASLDQMNVSYKVDQVSGLISVPASERHEVRLNLASQGLPSNGEKGFQVLYENQQFGTSAFLETARFNRALEEELQLSIATLNSVKSSRVHLAIPKRTSFIRAQKEVNASVLVNLKAGRSLDEDQVAGIVYLVSSSVSGLEPKGVTVVDQKGRLLSQRKSSSGIDAGAEQYRFVRQVEDKFTRSIVEILTPLVGEDRVRAQVNAELNFVSVEETSEQYNPDSLVLRSEQTISEQNSTGAGGAVEILSEDPQAEEPPEAPENRTIRATRNYEIDHRVSHIKETPGSIKRLSVAVIVDYRRQIKEDNSIERTPLTDQEMADIRILVKEAVGFVESRGDSVIVTNAPFLEAVVSTEEIPEVPLWQEEWVQAYSKILLGFVAIIVLILSVVRPMLKSVTRAPEKDDEVITGNLERMMETDSVSIAGHGSASLQSDYNRQLLEVKELVREDPTRAAKVIRDWVTVDA